MVKLSEDDQLEMLIQAYSVKKQLFSVKGLLNNVVFIVGIFA
jgi:hypothetical protein